MDPDVVKEFVDIISSKVDVPIERIRTRSFPQGVGARGVPHHKVILREVGHARPKIQALGVELNVRIENTATTDSLSFTINDDQIKQLMESQSMAAA